MATARVRKVAGTPWLHVAQQLAEVDDQGGLRQKPNDSVFEKWGDLAKVRLGISDDTARNWIAMATAAMPQVGSPAQAAIPKGS